MELIDVEYNFESLLNDLVNMVQNKAEEKGLTFELDVDQNIPRILHVVESLADAIDAKDRYTKGHSGRVASYSKEIAARYGYDDKDYQMRDKS